MAAPFAPLVALLAAAAAYTPPAHTLPPPLVDRMNIGELMVEGQRGTAIERMRSAKWVLAEHRRLSTALARVAPGRKGAVDAFVLSVALDSDPVFGREAREAARVLSRRYAATTRTLVLAGTDGSGPSTLPTGSPVNIAAALARIAEAMGPEDVLVLYTTSHGAQFGVVYNDADSGFGIIGPEWLATQLRDLGIKRRVLLISACYSGVFLGPLANDDTAIVTAATVDRTSFGCKADNDWTFFGDALINHALRKPQPFRNASSEAVDAIAGWERTGNLIASMPQVYVGASAEKWLATLEKTLPPPTPPVGKPATDALKP